ncbi:hypothetical protein [Chitinimonas koreensis]|uniref:hypothetical protein n=1 Tax=Chitinimonas koreensis TaxID=356302 RepID=UPI0016545C02|nr:hypothetical protein [Chitinimonas koreensis]QNM97423.1 hypothetical protein H9L41_03690 [Chitinimonas koreensis]
MPGFNDLRIGWRQLRQDPAYSAVVIVGLAVGIAVAFLLAGFVRSGLVADADVPARSRIARVELRYQNPAVRRCGGARRRYR